MSPRGWDGLRILSVAEILYLPILMLPSLSAAILLLAVFTPFMFVVVLVLYAACLMLLGGVIAALFCAVRSPGTRIDRALVDRIAGRFVAPGREIVAAKLTRANMRDLSIGAFVHSLFRARVVASGGLLVALLRGDDAARAIVAHEITHIRHFDRAYLAIIFVYLFNVVAGLFWLLSDGGMAPESEFGVGLFFWLCNVALTTMVLSRISVRRELAADYGAACWLGKPLYLEFLESVGGRHGAHGGGFYHPSLDARIAAIRSDRVCKPSLLLAIVYGILGATYIVQVTSAGDDSPAFVAMGVAQALYCGLGIMLEMLRWRIAKAPEREPGTQRPETV